MSSTALSIIDFSVSEAGQLAAHPLVSLGNISTISYAFLKTLTVGMRVNAFLKERLNSWTAEQRGLHLWNVAGQEWAGPILTFADIRLRGFGHREVDWSQNYVVAVNHTSAIDALVVPFCVPRGRIVAKAEALKFPVLGKAIAYGSQIMVNREDGSGMSSVREAMKDWLDCNVVFFVEGTRSLNGEISPFKAGAFKLSQELSRPILPIYIGGAYDALPKGPFLALKRSRQLTVSFGRPIPSGTGVDAQREATVCEMHKMSVYERAFR